MTRLYGVAGALVVLAGWVLWFGVGSGESGTYWSSAALGWIAPLPAGIATLWMLRRNLHEDGQRFLATVFGGMLVRLAVLGLALTAFVLLLDLPVVPFVAAAAIVYLGLQVYEVVLVLGRASSEGGDAAGEHGRRKPEERHES